MPNLSDIARRTHAAMRKIEEKPDRLHAIILELAEIITNINVHTIGMEVREEKV
jgi:hypothetical protein